MRAYYYVNVDYHSQFTRLKVFKLAQLRGFHNCCEDGLYPTKSEPCGILTQLDQKFFK